MELTSISTFLNIVTVFVLAIFVGFEMINKVPSLLHTPLMSGSNAISGISIVGAILALGLAEAVNEPTIKLIVIVFSIASVLFASINVVGGFIVTHRMLGKFHPVKKVQKAENK